MTVFISYSHIDKEFAERLIATLIQRRVPIWIDSIEMNVGDSFLTKIQGALKDSDFLAIVLSPNSIASEWCTKELNAGLSRELSEKKVVVLPLLLEDCDIPMFLQDKKYADFRTDFDTGLEDFLGPLQVLISEHLFRTNNERYQIDFAHDWGIDDGQFFCQTEAVSFEKDKPYSVSAMVRFEGNDVFTRRFNQFASAGFGLVGKNIAIEMCAQIFDNDDAHVTLPDDEPVVLAFEIKDPKTGIAFEIIFRARRLGEATGNTVCYHFGSNFGPMLRTIIERERDLSVEDQKILAKIFRSPIQ